jgi:hypothetical protein
VTALVTFHDVAPTSSDAMRFISSPPSLSTALRPCLPSTAKAVPPPPHHTSSPSPPSIAKDLVRPPRHRRLKTKNSNLDSSPPSPPPALNLRLARCRLTPPIPPRLYHCLPLPPPPPSSLLAPPSGILFSDSWTPTAPYALLFAAVGRVALTPGAL